jgi:hypothetical protein
MTDGDAKEWVTVKVPREDKAQADEYRPDGSTFGDCLVAGAERLADGLDSDTRRFEPDGATADVDELAEKLADRIDYPESVDTEDIARRLEALESIESRVGSIERTLEDLGSR